MAIKGKKRSRQRGSQGARKPAAAPKPALGPSRKGTPWYRSPLTVGVVAIFGLVAIGILIALIANIRDRAEDLESRQSVLESYTENVRAPLEMAASPASQMSGLVTPPGGDDLEGLAEDAEAWIAEFQEAQTQLAQNFPGPEATGVNQLFNEALGLYISAANTFATLPDIEAGPARQEVFTQAGVVRDTAHAVFESAITVLDQIREDAELGSSGLRPPVPAGQAPAVEAPEIEAPEGSDDAAGDTVVIPGDDAGSEPESDDGAGGQEGGAEDDDGGGS